MFCMSTKNDTEVIIGGKVFVLSGYESEEYLQRVASYISNKINEYNRVDGFKRLPLDTQAVMIELNIADDFFKAKEQITALEEEIRSKEKEIYDLKHDLINARIRLDEQEKKIKAMNAENTELQRKIMKLEAGIQ